ELARVGGFSQGAVTDWERGKAPLPEAALRALLKLSQSRPLQTKPLTGADLRKIRTDRKMRQADFAAKLGVSEIALRRWEHRGTQALSSSTMRRIALHLDELEASAPTPAAA